MKEDDANWPEPDRVGRQELEIVMGNEHISFTTSKIGSLVDVQSSKDPEGLRIFYYLVQVKIYTPLSVFILFALYYLGVDISFECTIFSLFCASRGLRTRLTCVYLNFYANRYDVFRLPMLFT